MGLELVMIMSSRVSRCKAVMHPLMANGSLAGSLTIEPRVRTEVTEGTWKFASWYRIHGDQAFS